MKKDLWHALCFRLLPECICGCITGSYLYDMHKNVNIDVYLHYKKNNNINKFHWE